MEGGQRVHIKEKRRGAASAVKRVREECNGCRKRGGGSRGSECKKGEGKGGSEYCNRKRERGQRMHKVEEGSGATHA